MTKRRSILTTFREKYGGFCGWKTLCRTVDNITNEDSKIIFIGLFLTGARGSELPTLYRRQVDLDSDDECIWIRNMNVEKRRDKEYIDNEDESEGRRIFKDNKGRMYILVPTIKHRTFPIVKTNPLAELFMEHVDSRNPEEKVYDYTYGQISYRIGLVDADLPSGYYKDGWWKYRGPWWPHRLRAERACQLRRDYRYDTYSLKKWFGWGTKIMPDLYVDMLPLDLKYGMMDRSDKWR